MMDVKELRIGNLIKDYAGRIVIVSAKTLADMETGGWADANYIQFTEEWALRCGFTVTHPEGHTNWIVADKEPCWLQSPDGNGEWFTYSEYDHDYSYKSEPIKYLHTVQNLYFAVTNKELEIKI